MRRTHLAIVLLLVAVAAAAAAVAGAAPAKRFKYSHRATVDGLYVDHWTIDEPYACGRVGDGTVTVRWRFKKVTKVRLLYDRYAGASGSWVLGSPAGGGVGHLPSQPGVGTITLSDNTVQHPPDPGDICEEQTPKSDCGTVALLGPPLAEVTGDGKHQLVADLARVDFGRRGGAGRAVKCSIGQTRLFDDTIYSGRANEGKLAIPMASVAAVAHRRAIRLVGSSHRASGSLDCPSGVTCSDDVTRKVTVTFKRL